MLSFNPFLFHSLTPVTNAVTFPIIKTLCFTMNLINLVRCTKYLAVINALVGIMFIFFPSASFHRKNLTLDNERICLSNSDA